jgi:hypothetical protein
MGTFERVCELIFHDSRWRSKFLVGGMLSFVPFLNIFAMGYLYRVNRNMWATHKVSLPEWVDWKGLFVDGLRALFVMGIVMLPFLVVGGGMSVVLANGFHFIFLDLFSNTLALFPFVVALFISIPIAFFALVHFQRTERWETLLDLSLYREFFFLSMRELLIPTIALNGLLIWGFPIWGFSIFFNILVGTVFYNAVYQQLIQHRS